MESSWALSSFLPRMRSMMEFMHMWICAPVGALCLGFGATAVRAAPGSLVAFDDGHFRQRHLDLGEIVARQLPDLRDGNLAATAQVVDMAGGGLQVLGEFLRREEAVFRPR